MQKKSATENAAIKVRKHSCPNVIPNAMQYPHISTKIKHTIEYNGENTNLG